MWKNEEQHSSSPLRGSKKVLDKFIFYSLILGFLGFLDATYLTILHYKNVIPPCTIGSCETVMTSKYSMVGPLPLALLGSLFYLGVIVLCLLLITNYKRIFLDFFYLLVAIGFLVSLVLLYIQGFLLHAFCQYCLLSEAISTGLLILAFLKFKEDSPSGEAGKKIK